jgi:hypothetical protein
MNLMLHPEAVMVQVIRNDILKKSEKLKTTSSNICNLNIM